MGERLFGAANYDLEELCRRLNDQQRREGRAVTRSPRMTKSGFSKGRTKRSTRRAGETRVRER